MKCFARKFTFSSTVYEMFAFCFYFRHTISFFTPLLIFHIPLHTLSSTLLSFLHHTHTQPQIPNMTPTTHTSYNTYTYNTHTHNIHTTRKLLFSRGVWFGFFANRLEECTSVRLGLKTPQTSSSTYWRLFGLT